jgi:CRP/FNR family transcriptional regulator
MTKPRRENFGCAKPPSEFNFDRFGHESCKSPICANDAFQDETAEKHYPKRSVLFAEGQPALGVHVLCEGRAKISMASAEGKTLVLGIAKPGDLLGMRATLTGEPYAASVETLEPSRLRFIPRENLIRVLDHDQGISMRVALALSEKLGSLFEQTRLLFLSQNAAEKLARLLIKWCDEGGKQTTRGMRIESGLTHEEIAQMICSSRETVTRVFGVFKRNQILSLEGDAIIILDREALEEVLFKKPNL